MKRTLKKILTAVGVVLALACAIVVHQLTVNPSTEERSDGTVVCKTNHGLELPQITQGWLKYTVYDVDDQADIAQDLEGQHDGQTIDDPLVVYNPFGTSTQSLYIYFETEESASITYTVSVSDEQVATITDDSLTSTSIDDFTREVDDGEASTEHEFMLYGLIPGVENGVSVTATYEDGSSETHEFTCKMCDVIGDEELQLVVEEGSSTAELTDGLYAILGNENSVVPFIYLYDNQGILRGEIPLVYGRSQRLIFEDDLMYYETSNTQLAAMNDIGQIVQVYDVSKDANYRLHHDYISDGENHLIALGSDFDTNTVEDLVFFINQETGEIDTVIDLGELLPAYKEAALAYYGENGGESTGFDGEEGVDWLHVNTVQWMGDDSILLSCRQTSSIIKVSDVYGTPTLEYIIGNSEIWEGTGYEDLVFEQVGDFLINGGQHSITYVEDDSLEDGQYYVSMFDNNVGIITGTAGSFDWDSIGLTHVEGTTDEEGVYSYYYKYLVDENEGTFELVESFEVPYSGYNSSTQEVGENVVVDSGMLGTFGEYDEDGVLIRQFTMEIDSLLYRVFKYDL